MAVRRGVLALAAVPLTASLSNSIAEPMTNCPRFFPALLAAHRHLGDVCTASSAPVDNPSAEGPSAKRRAPVLSLIALAAFLTGAILVHSALGEDRPGVVKGVVPSPERTSRACLKSEDTSGAASTRGRASRRSESFRMPCITPETCRWSVGEARPSDSW